MVKLDKGDFLGRDALAAQKAGGSPSKLVGFEVRGGESRARVTRLSREGGEPVGEVTSGTWSPTFEKALGMAYVPPGWRRRERRWRSTSAARPSPAVVVETPFYKRPRSG